MHLAFSVKECKSHLLSVEIRILGAIAPEINPFGPWDSFEHFNQSDRILATKRPDMYV